MSEQYGISWRKIVVWVICLSLFILHSALRIVSIGVIKSFLYIVWFILPLGSGPDDFIFLFVLVVIGTLLTIFSATRAWFVEIVKDTLAFLFLTKKGKLKRRKAKISKALGGIPVPDEDLDLSDDFFDTLKMEEGHQE